MGGEGAVMGQLISFGDSRWKERVFFQKKGKGK